MLKQVLRTNKFNILLFSVNTAFCGIAIYTNNITVPTLLCAFAAGFIGMMIGMTIVVQDYKELVTCQKEFIDYLLACREKGD